MLILCQSGFCIQCIVKQLVQHMILLLEKYCYCWCGHSYYAQSGHKLQRNLNQSRILEVTVPNHGFFGEYVKFDDGSITFSCDKDNYGSNHDILISIHIETRVTCLHVGVKHFSICWCWFYSNYIFPATTNGLKSRIHCWCELVLIRLLV